MPTSCLPSCWTSFSFASSYLVWWSWAALIKPKNCAKALRKALRAQVVVTSHPPFLSLMAFPLHEQHDYMRLIYPDTLTVKRSGRRWEEEEETACVICGVGGAYCLFCPISDHRPIMWAAGEASLLLQLIPVFAADHSEYTCFFSKPVNQQSSFFVSQDDVSQDVTAICHHMTVNSVNSIYKAQAVYCKNAEDELCM